MGIRVYVLGMVSQRNGLFVSIVEGIVYLLGAVEAINERNKAAGI